MFGILIILIVIAVFAFVIVRGIAEWNRNNHSPRLDVEAAVVAKRTDVSHYHHPNTGDASGVHGFRGFHTSTSTTYHATFRVASGDRLELRVSGREYGALAEGDKGTLSFQGTRYLHFSRIG
ncbi:MAG: DUF2500 domain-containing protein [Clostridiales bacterium]|nr:DUF2500 domain-containing protein [Clostridiales bacterium]MDY4035721.1 DUF2500 domain-containing protein [Candidatus Pseudoscilispira sp.]